MILVLGSSLDRVFPTLLAELRRSGYPFVVVDEDHPAPYAVRCEEQHGQLIYHLTGGECTGDRPVGAIFVRHAVMRTLEQQHTLQLTLLQTALNRMLLAATCPVINQPSHAYSNYSKPYQVGLLAAAGFDVPRTLVTNVADDVLQFYETCQQQVIFKGVSNVTTLAQVLTPDRMGRLAHLANSPTLFQEYVAGIDYRVHVIGDDALVTRLVAPNEDYRRSALIHGDEISVEAASLPPAILDRCVAFTRQQGLIVSGIDFKETPDGRLVALELNPFPQFTFYERGSGQPLTQTIVHYLGQHLAPTNCILA